METVQDEDTQINSEDVDVVDPGLSQEMAYEYPSTAAIWFEQQKECDLLRFVLKMIT